MIRVPRRLVVAASAIALLGALPASSAVAADHTQVLNIGAELVNQPKGKPWVVNLELGADMGMTDGTVPSPINNMHFQFTKGAKVHTEAFKTCTAAILQAKGPDACPSRAKLGTGLALASALGLDPFHADVTVFNGPGTTSNRKLLVYARVREIPTIVVILEGTLKKVNSGKFGWDLNIPVPPIHTVGEGNDASIISFNVKVGGYGTVKGRKTPFIEAPTKCTSPGWPFSSQFSYADGASGGSSAVIGCTLHAANT